MALRLAAELNDALENRGTAVKKREDVHRMAKPTKHSHISVGNYIEEN